MTARTGERGGGGLDVTGRDPHRKASKINKRIELRSRDKTGGQGREEHRTQRSATGTNVSCGEFWGLRGLQGSNLTRNYTGVEKVGSTVKM
jgi:hypothetical protein